MVQKLENHLAEQTKTASEVNNLKKFIFLSIKK